MREANLPALACCLLLTQGCVSTSVRNGTILGAAGGAVAGGVLGYAISDEGLLGSKENATGPMDLPGAESVVAGLLVGAVFGAIIGSVVGNTLDDPDQDAYEAALAKATALEINSNTLDLDSEASDDEELDDEEPDDEEPDDEEPDDEELDDEELDGE